MFKNFLTEGIEKQTVILTIIDLLLKKFHSVLNTHTPTKEKNLDVCLHAKTFPNLSLLFSLGQWMQLWKRSNWNYFKIGNFHHDNYLAIAFPAFNYYGKIIVSLWSGWGDWKKEHFLSMWWSFSIFGPWLFLYKTRSGNEEIH